MSFPDEALEFYEGLEADNTKAYWTAHREVYERCVRAPMQALLEALEPEFGPGAMFRPYRDVRFSRDKSPYKTHQGAVAGGFYVHVSAAGVLVAGGYHQTTPDQVARLRAAVADDVTGPALAQVLDRLRDDRFEVDGDRLKTRPRGYPPDHPRMGLLRYRTLVAFRTLDGLGSVEEVRAAWRRMRPLTQWLDRHVGAGRE
jgi:uncharacterized protein (TIGR02453 family)